jgi:hypothetical protein
MKKYIFLLLIITSSCKKFIDVDEPKTEIGTATVFSSDKTAISALLGIYSDMMFDGYASGGNNSAGLITGLTGDEYLAYAPEAQFLAENAILPNNGQITNSLWNIPYKHIYTANSILAALPNSPKITDPVRTLLTGEATFIRAFCYFYLTNFFGDVPLYTTPDYIANSKLSRTAANSIFDQVIKDLQEAEKLLLETYPTEGRVRPNKWVARALLARVYLYLQNWDAASEYATMLIDHYQLENDLDAVFLATSQEAIWQLMPVIPLQNTQEGAQQILTSAPSYAALSPYLTDSFEVNDQRKQKWIGSYTDSSSNETWHYAYKYKVSSGDNPVTEYEMVFRLTEQYLIRAEARAHKGDVSGAQADLNAIRKRAGLANTTAKDPAGLLVAIMHERKVELFSECGHRWLDLKRTGTADEVLSGIKGSGWQSTDILFPIPQVERNNNKNITQNPGY